MTDKSDYPKITNVFEIALHQEFRKLQLGEPDKKLRKAIDKASKKISAEVKRLTKDLYKKEEKRKKQELKRLRKQQAAKKSGRTNKNIRKVKQQSRIVEDIIA